MQIFDRYLFHPIIVYFPSLPGRQRYQGGHPRAELQVGIVELDLDPEGDQILLAFLLVGPFRGVTGLGADIIDLAPVDLARNAQNLHRHDLPQAKLPQSGLTHLDLDVDIAQIADGHDGHAGGDQFAAGHRLHGDGSADRRFDFGVVQVGLDFVRSCLGLPDQGRGGLDVLFLRALPDQIVLFLGRVVTGPGHFQLGAGHIQLLLGQDPFLI